MKTFHSCIPACCYSWEFPFGMVTVQWAAEPKFQLKKIELTPLKGKSRINESLSTLSEIETIFKALQSGDSSTVPENWLDLSSLNAFSKKVLLTLKKTVPSGKGITYSALAEKAGTPRAARAVGNALSQNPFPLIIPCHRVICASGAVGGFQGIRNSTELKKTLLESEGITFDNKGRVKKEYFLRKILTEIS